MRGEEVADLLGGFMGVDKTPYYCNKCANRLQVITVKTLLEGMKKLFYCESNHCIRFGLVTVVAKKGHHA